MIYMDDCIKATIELMIAPKENISCRTSYNVSGLSFSPIDLAKEIQKRNPNFEVTFKPDYRQEIAATWPASIDDSLARKDWDWKPNFDIEKLTNTMIDNVRMQYKSQGN